jgi:hypothetical protein
MRWILLLLSCSVAWAACSGASPAWTAASISQTDVNACYTAASAGDTVNVPNGTTGTWSTLTDSKGLTTVCPGGSCTITTSSAAWDFACPPGTHFSRLTGFTFTGIGNSNNGDVEIDGPTSGSGCTARVDHNTFTNSGLSKFIAVTYASGNTVPPEFVIDHNSFSGGAASEMIHNLAYGPGTTTGWTNDVTPGGQQMLFVEDNTFTTAGNCSTPYASAIEAYYGSATCFRHNTLTFNQVDQHGTCSNVYARWWEIYDNSFVIPSGYNQSNLSALRGGSGVMWGNTLTGSNASCSDPAPTYELTEDCSSGGYPITDQIGRGISQNSSPAYVWGNGATAVGSGNPTYVEVGATTGACGHSPCDAVSTTSQPGTLIRCQSAADVSAGCPVSYSYSPYVYPNPLTMSPAAGTGTTLKIGVIGPGVL